MEAYLQIFQDNGLIPDDFLPDEVRLFKDFLVNNLEGALVKINELRASPLNPCDSCYYYVMCHDDYCDSISGNINDLMVLKGKELDMITAKLQLRMDIALSKNKMSVVDKICDVLASYSFFYSLLPRGQ